MLHPSSTLRKRVAIAAVCVLSTLGATVALLRFGNPQWHKYVFMFQAYVSPGEDPDVPEDFTGTWRTWYKNGGAMNEIQFRDGAQHGLERVYFPDGDLWEESSSPRSALAFFAPGG
jgi:hypothetical protein